MTEPALEGVSPARLYPRPVDLEFDVAELDRRHFFKLLDDVGHVHRLKVFHLVFGIVFLTDRSANRVFMNVDRLVVVAGHSDAR